MQAMRETSRKAMNNEQFFDYEPQRKVLIEYTEKSALRRAVWGIALPCILFFFATRFWWRLALYVFNIFGISEQTAIKIFTEPAVSQIASIVLSLVLLILPFSLSCIIAGGKVSYCLALIKPKKNTALPYFLFGLGFCSFSNIAVSFAGRIFENFGFRSVVPENEDPSGLFGFLLVIISTVIVPAIAEEFAFRGVALSLLKPFGEGFAIIGSAAAFALLHGNFDQMFFAFLVGLVLGYIRIKTGSILICMCTHAANNLIAVVLSYFTDYPRYITEFAYTIYIVLALTLSVLGLALLKGKDNFSFKEYDGFMPKPKIYRRYFFSAGMIIVALLYVFRAFSYVNI